MTKELHLHACMVISSGHRRHNTACVDVITLAMLAHHSMSYGTGDQIWLIYLLFFSHCLCYHADKIIREPAAMAIQRDTISTKVKLFKCDVCGKKYPWQSSLRLHRRVHIGTRPYPCPNCNKNFHTAGLVHRHFNLHRHERPHMCYLCSEPFLTFSTLRMHHRFHTGIRPYKCATCEKPFFEPFPLYIHVLRTHKELRGGDRPFACRLCGKRFSFVSTLQVGGVH